MAEAPGVARRSALAAVYGVGPRPGPDGACRVRLAQWTPGYLALVEGAALEVPTASVRILWAGTPEVGFEALPIGPGRWLVVGLGAEARPEAAELRSLFPAGAPAPRIFDLGHARVVVRADGPAVRDLLAQGCPVDLDALAPGQCAASVLGPVHAVLHRLDPARSGAAEGGDAFDLYLPRGYAVSAWEWLLEAAREFGCDVLEPHLPTV